MITIELQFPFVIPYKIGLIRVFFPAPSNGVESFPFFDSTAKNGRPYKEALSLSLSNSLQSAWGSSFRLHPIAFNKKYGSYTFHSVNNTVPEFVARILGSDHSIQPFILLVVGVAESCHTLHHERPSTSMTSSLKLGGMSNFSSEINRYRIKFVTSRIAQVIASSAHPLGILKLLSSVINKGTCIHGALKILFHFLLDTNHTYNNDPSY